MHLEKGILLDIYRITQLLGSLDVHLDSTYTISVPVFEYFAHMNYSNPAVFHLVAVLLRAVDSPSPFPLRALARNAILRGLGGVHCKPRALRLPLPPPLIDHIIYCT